MRLKKSISHYGLVFLALILGCAPGRRVYVSPYLIESFVADDKAIEWRTTSNDDSSFAVFLPERLCREFKQKSYINLNLGSVSKDGETLRPLLANAAIPARCTLSRHKFAAGQKTMTFTYYVVFGDISHGLHDIELGDPYTLRVGKCPMCIPDKVTPCPSCGGGKQSSGEHSSTSKTTAVPRPTLDTPHARHLDVVCGRIPIIDTVTASAGEFLAWESDYGSVTLISGTDICKNGTIKPCEVTGALGPHTYGIQVTPKPGEGSGCSSPDRTLTIQ